MKALRQNRNILFILLLILIVGRYLSPYIQPEQEISNPAQQENIGRVFSQQKSDVQVTGSGTVVKVLRDDLKGSRHQKMIVKVSSGQTVLIAHNIDLAPRIPNLKAGDRLQFHGEYEWNSKGGVVHWTHKDPKNRHVDGWLKHNGTVYQ